MMYTVYILECADGSLYAGCTNDFERRLHEHNHAKCGAHYTKIRRPVKPVYREEFSALAPARAREAAIKRLSRVEKNAIINP